MKTGNVLGRSKPDGFNVSMTRTKHWQKKKTEKKPRPSKVVLVYSLACAVSRLSSDFGISLVSVLAGKANWVGVHRHRCRYLAFLSLCRVADRNTRRVGIVVKGGNGSDTTRVERGLAAE